MADASDGPGRPGARRGRAHAAGALLLLTLLPVAACGDDDAGAASAARTSSASPTESPTPTPETPETPTGTATTTDDTADLIPLCQALAPEEVEAVTGFSDLTVEEATLGTGCTYATEGAALDGLVSFIDVAATRSGSLLEVLEINAVGVEAEVEELDIGDGAYLYAGSFGEGEKAEAGLSAGGTEVLMTYYPEVGAGTPTEEVRAVAVALLELAASEL